jgi:membrane fusion protein, heavy metal efflux system
MSYQVTRFLVLSLLLALTSCESDRSEPAAGQASASTVAPGMCAEHGVPDALCTKCNPALAQVFKAKGDWCAEHGFPESFCPICKPNAAFPDVGAAPAVHDWCGGHGLPESKCTKCNPSLVSKYKQSGDWCDEHGFPESVCPICNPQTIPAGAPGSGSFAAGTKIRFRSPEIEKTAGIETVPARKAIVGSGVSCTARIEYNQNKLADIRALVPGVVRKLRADLGQKVKKGAPLFVLESTQVGQLQARLPGLEQQVRTARANHKRKKELAADGLLAQRKVEIAQQELASAEAGIASARSALRLAGAPGGGGGSYVLTSPLSGTLVRRPAVIGAYATADTSLGTVANTSTMWALFDVPEASANAVAVGQSVSIVIDGAGDVSHRGEITWIASEVDPKTRMVVARAEIKNKAGAVRANQFARAVIETSSKTETMMVPRDALQRFGDEALVFVRISAGVYEPRIVVVGAGSAKEVQVTGDVKPKDAVVTTGAYLLKTELSPESIGAGCCDVEAPEGG